MLKVYRIRLKGTDLYYQTVKGRFNGEKSNLGRNGRIYIGKKPRLCDIASSVRVSDSVQGKYGMDFCVESWNKEQKYLAGKVEDIFEIITYNCAEEK